MHRVVFLRHGESQYNVLKRFAGWLDCDLNLDGIRQAKRAGQMLLDLGYSFDVAYSSALKRAISTLQCVLDEMSLNSISVNQSWRLNERHFGALDDLTNEEAELRFGQETLRLCREDFRFYPPISGRGQVPYFCEKPPVNMIPKSESMYDATSRCLVYWQHVIINSVRTGKCALVVAHGDILRLLTGYLLGMKEDEIIHLPVIANAIPLVFDFDNDFRVSAHYYLEEIKNPI